MSFSADDLGNFLVKENEGGVQSSLMLLTMMIDDSTSMLIDNNYQAVLSAHNNLLNTLEASPQSSLFWAMTYLMHGRALERKHLPLPKVPRLKAENYRLAGGTPLFRATCRILRYVNQRARQLKQEGNNVKTMTILITDGWNQDRHRGATAERAKGIIRPMIESRDHIVAGAGISSPDIDFVDVFLSMGIPQQWIISLRSAQEIERGFTEFAYLSRDATQSKEAFEETQSRGFGSTKG